MKFAVSLAAFVLAGFVSTGTAPAATYYVDQKHAKASDSNPGTASLPWKTIQKAATTLIAGDTVYVKAGTYKNRVEPTNSGSLNKFITYSAYPGQEQQVVIDGSDIYIRNKSYITVNGFKVTNTYYGINVIGPSVSNINISNNYTYNTTGSGIIVLGVPYQSDPAKYGYKGVTKITIKGNLIERACNGGYNEMITLQNGVDNFTITGNRIFNGYNNVKGGEGLDVKEGASNGKIYGNEIYNIPKLAIYLDAGRGTYASVTPKLTNIEIYANRVHETGAGITVSTEGPGTVDSVRIYNNLVYRNKSHGVVIYRHPDGTGAFKNITIANNTSYKNGMWGVLVNHPGASNVTVRNNISYANGTSCTCNFSKSQAGTGFQESNNLFGSDPSFTAPDAGDLTLKSESAAIDKGSSVGAPVVDYRGTPRPQLKAFDIGAFEYGG